MEDLLGSGSGNVVMHTLVESRSGLVHPGIGQTYQEDSEHPLTTANGATSNDHAMPWLKHSKSCQETTDRPHSLMPMVGSTYFWDGSSSHEADLERGWWWPSHDHYQWWNLRISEIVLLVMKPTMQDDDGDFPLTRQDMISQPRSQNHTFWPEMWLERWLHARKICANNLKMFEMHYSVCVCMSLLAYYHLGWIWKQWKKVKKQWKKVKSVKKSRIYSNWFCKYQAAKSLN